MRKLVLTTLLSIIALLTFWNSATFASTIEPIRLFEGHPSDSIGCVVFSPDGNQLASAGTDNTVRIWDVATTKEIQRIEPQSTGRVMCVAFSPDGRALAAGFSDGSIGLLDVKSGKVIRKLSGHTDNVTSVSFSPDGRSASGSLDRTVRLRDFNSGAETERYEGYMEDLNSVAFSPDGKFILCNGVDGTVLLWDALNPEPVMSFRRPTIRLGGLSYYTVFRSVAFSPDGRLIAAGGVTGSGHDGEHHGIIFLWDAKTDEEIRQINPQIDDIACVTFSPDGHSIASSGWADKLSSKIDIWDAATGKLVQSFPVKNDIVYSIAFSPKGGYIASGSAGGAWDPPEFLLWPVK